MGASHGKLTRCFCKKNVSTNALKEAYPALTGTDRTGTQFERGTSGQLRVRQQSSKRSQVNETY